MPRPISIEKSESTDRGRRRTPKSPNFSAKLFLRLRVVQLSKKFTRWALGHLGLALVSQHSLLELQKRPPLDYLEILRFIVASGKGEWLIPFVASSRSQLGQELLALFFAGESKKGYFVEFGATNGVALSNSYLLETEFGWKGILAEPSRFWQKDLKKNRQVAIDNRCVWSEDDKFIRFWETEVSELSTIGKFQGSDGHSSLRRIGSSYEVETVTLLSLLDFHNAPEHIDFLSIDTEGSEFEILNSFDFLRYSFGFIAVEHNYTPIRERIHGLLVENGYLRILPEISRFDDWYVPANAA